MGEPMHRPVSYLYRVGREDVVVTIHEYYDGENPVPTIVKVTGPNGLVTKDFHEMLDLLGIPHPYPPVPKTEPQSDEPSPEPSTEQSATPTNSDLGHSTSTPDDPDDEMCVSPDLGSTTRFTRSVRVGDEDIQIWEWEQYPKNGPRIPVRRWFEAPNGIRTRGYYEMLDRLGARPTPLLPEDEHRPPETSPSDATDFESAGNSPTGQAESVGATNPDGIKHVSTQHDTGQHTSTSAADKPAKRKRQERARRRVGVLPPVEKSVEDMSETERQMQIIWLAEKFRELNPDLYEAALDSVKRKVFLEREAEQNRVAAEAAPRCQFVKSTGEACGAPAIKSRRYCHFHCRTAPTRKSKKEVEVPVLEDDRAIQMTVTRVCRGLADGSLESKRAATLLYGLQVASVAVRMKKAAKQ